MNARLIHLTLMALLLMVGNACFAADYDLTVAGVHVTDENAADILGDGSVSYDPIANQLSLTNATITDEYQGIGNMIPDLMIVVAGNNHISSSTYSALYSFGSLTIGGNGSLYVTGPVAISVAAGDLTLTDGCTVTATATCGPMALYGDIFAAIYGENDMTLIVDNSTLFARTQLVEREPYVVYPIYCEDNEPQLEGNCFFNLEEMPVWDNESHFYRYANGEPILDDLVIGVEYQLALGTTSVTSLNCNDVFQDGGKAIYDPIEKTLALTRIAIDEPDFNGLVSMIPDLKIVLTGYNSIVSGSDAAVYCFKDFSIGGTGSLDVRGTSGIVALTGSLTIEDGCVVQAIATKNSANSAGIKVGASGASFVINHSTVYAGVDIAENEDVAAYPIKGAEPQLVECGLISPIGALWDGENHYYVDAEGNAIRDLVKIISEFDLMVNGTIVDYANYPDVFGDGKVSFDPYDNILTLDNVTFEYSDQLACIFNLIDGLYINLVGENKIVSSTNGIWSSMEDLVIGGHGSLDVTGTNGIYALLCDLTIKDGCTVTATGTKDNESTAGIYGSANHTVTIINSNVTAKKQEAIAGYPIKGLEPQLIECALVTPVGAVWDTVGHYYVDAAGAPIKEPIVIKSASNVNEIGTSASFAYFSNGELVVANEGRNTLLVVDMMGRIVSSQTLDGDARISTNGMSAGVYVLRLGDRIQKVVVR